MLTGIRDTVKGQSLDNRINKNPTVIINIIQEKLGCSELAAVENAIGIVDKLDTFYKGEGIEEDEAALRAKVIALPEETENDDEDEFEYLDGGAGDGFGDEMPTDTDETEETGQEPLDNV